MTEVLIIILVAIAFGIFFFIADYYEHKISPLHASFIAGISIAYFFLIVLPEIAENLPAAPFELPFFEYLFVLIGFSFVHITEKLILRKVESKTQKKMDMVTGNIFDHPMTQCRAGKHLQCVP